MENLPQKELEEIVDELFEWSDMLAHAAMRRIIEASNDKEIK